MKLTVLICVCLMMPMEVWAKDSKLLWLVNHSHPIAVDYRPENLVNVDNYLIRPEAGIAFTKMLEDMHKDKLYGLKLQSGYRPYNYQKAIFSDKMTTLRQLGYSEAESRELAMKSVALPGASEHQTGLAIDVSVNGQLTVLFGDTEAGIWLKNNSAKYGYIVRYPKEKTAITRIIYEPWHLRYVGVPHAQYMHEYNLCLEEYIHHVKEAGIILFWINEKSYFKISYVERLPQGIEESEALNETLDVSSIGPDENSGYIVTEMR